MNVVHVNVACLQKDFEKVILFLAIPNPPPAPKIKKVKEVAPKLPDKTKWTLEEQKQFFSALRIVGMNCLFVDR